MQCLFYIMAFIRIIRKFSLLIFASSNTHEYLFYSACYNLKICIYLITWYELQFFIFLLKHVLLKTFYQKKENCVYYII